MKLTLLLLLTISTVHPKELKRPVFKPVPKITRTCMIDKEGVPRCIILGTFPTNPGWEQILKSK